jgi:MFS family permease
MVWLGAGGLILGLAGTIPTAVNAFSQVLAARGSVGARGARAFIARAWLLQGLTLGSLGCLALLPPSLAVPFLCGGAVLTWVFGGLSVPAWTWLISRTVPRVEQGRFFGLRGAAQQTGVVLAILAGGWLLSATSSTGRTALGFVLVFAVAGLFRVAGTGLLAGVPERRRSSEQPPVRSLLEVFKASAKFRRLAAYSWSLHFATWVAAPFFLPYMLRDLHLDYSTVGLLMAVPAIVKALTMRWWGGVADRIGPGPLLRRMGWVLLPVSAMWLFSGNVGWIVAAQAYAGLAWGGMELALASALLQTTRGREDAIALFNVVDGAVMIFGSAVGGLIVMGAEHVLGVGFLAAIAASTILRFLAAVLFLPRVRSIGSPAFSHRRIPMRLWGVRAARGATFRPWVEPSTPGKGSNGGDGAGERPGSA